MSGCFYHILAVVVVCHAKGAFCHGAARYSFNPRRVKSTPDPNTCEKVSRYTSHFYRILLQKYALLLAESSIYTTNVYHDTPPTLKQKAVEQRMHATKTEISLSRLRSPESMDL